MSDPGGMVILRDSTLREGLDTPGVSFTPDQKLLIAGAMDRASVPELEIVAPSRVIRDMDSAKRIKDAGLRLRTSGLIYSYSPRAAGEIERAGDGLDRFDLLMPVSPRRKPFERRAKIETLLDLLALALSRHPDVGVGFPHSTQVDAEFLIEIARRASESGATRLTIYDTNGGADPFSVYDLIGRVRQASGAPIFFHGHNDLGLATANALAAIRAGADGLDVTVNGLGDRAGNASLEQAVMALHLRGFRTGVALAGLKELSAIVERESGVAVSKLAPVVGDFIARHKSPSHLEHPDLFEAFDPALLGTTRTVEEQS